MAEEKNNSESKKFQSGTVYKKNTTDYSAFLKDVNERKKEDKEQKIHNSQVSQPTKPPKKCAETSDDKFRSILSAALKRDDEDEDDAFEAYTPKTQKEPEAVKVQEEAPVIPNETKEDVIEETQAAETMPEPTTEPDAEPERIVESETAECSPETEPDIQQAETEPSSSETPDEEKSDISVEEKTEETQEPEEEKLKTLDELFELNKDKATIIEFGQAIRAENLIANEALEKGAVIKKVFNPNPPKHLIEGRDFNDPYLDDIYNYTYPDQIIEIRKRMAEERKERLEAQLAEEARLEELKNKRQGKHKKNAEKVSTKPPKHINIPDRYPKQYEDPTDEEIDEKTGRPYHYFNFGKTLHNSKLRFLEKILPVAAIDDVLYDKGFLDGVADRQHDKSVRLNNMSAEEQYARDLRNIGIKIAAAAVFIFAVFAKITFDIMPDREYAQAVAYMDAMDYENAYYAFSELGTKELSTYYAKYSEAKMLLKVGKYQEAKEAFTMLLPFEEDIFKPKGLQISDEINECSYQIALSYYYNGDFETAKNIFKEIYTYSDSTQRYYECGFRIANDAYQDWQDTDDLKKALKYFYRVKKYSAEDVEGYIKDIQDELYSEADSAYKNKNYTSAIELFEYLALFKYVNEEDQVSSVEMVSQCTYRYGLDLYKSRKYESARKVLSTIPEYKDSYVLSKECIYNIARILFENNPVGSIAEYNKIIGYKDSNSTLYSPRLVMYGEWEIIETNGSAVTPIKFRFHDDGRFVTDNMIMCVAISTAASPIYYEWDGDKFTALNGQYTITPSYDLETGKMTLVCKSPEQMFTHKCRRTMTYEEMVYSMDETNKTEASQETMNQKYQKLIGDYINKKLDHIVVIGGQDINVFDGKTD